MSDCANLPHLLRLRDAGETAAVEAHLAECPACAEAWRDLEALTALGRALPDGQPDARRRESVRTRILAEATAPPPRPRWRLVALAAAAAIGAWIVGTQFDSAPPPLGRIASAPGAVFSVSKTGGDEVVTLSEGRLTIRVPHLAAGRRFVVLTDDAEVEVRGTAFTVEASDGRLRAVEVEAGVVEVRPAGADAVRLRTAQRWPTDRGAGPGPREWPGAKAEGPRAAVRAPAGPREETRPGDARPPPRRADAATTEPPPRGPRKARPDPVDARRAVEARPAGEGAADAGPPTLDVGAAQPETGGSHIAEPDASPAASPQTVRFDAGWTALRAGRPADAAPAFADAAALGGPLTADARWWHAVALGRAGDDAAARRALTHFMTAHPGSPRRLEAAVMAGWLDFAAGRVDAAEAAFREGLGARRAAVRESARTGLAAVADWRAKRGGADE